MLIACPRCLTKYRLDESSLPASAELSLRCSRCGWEFVCPRPVVSAPEETVSAPAPEAVGSGEVFELADDFTAAEAAATPSSEEPEAAGVEPEDSAAAAGSGAAGTEPDEAEELALDLDDLDLEDIEFDDFGADDDAADSGADGESSPAGAATRIDDEGVDELLQDEAEAPADLAASPVRERDVEVVLADVDEAAARRPHSGRRNGVLLLACFLVFSLALWGGYGLWRSYSFDMAKLLRFEKVKTQTLRLPSGRRLALLQGEVVNGAPNQVFRLRIRGVLLDARGQAVARAETAGGVSFSVEELDRLDKAKLALLENPQAVIPAHGRLPFMLAFYDYPEAARQGQVEIISFKVKKAPRRLKKAR